MVHLSLRLLLVGRSGPRRRCEVNRTQRIVGASGLGREYSCRRWLRCGLDELPRVLSGKWINGVAVDVKIIIRYDSRSAVDGTPAAIEDSSKHIVGYR